MSMNATARKQHLALLGAGRQDASRRTPDYRVADVRRLPYRKRRAGLAAAHRLAGRAAKRATGRGRFTMHHPGAAGHERCRDICVTFG